MANNRYADAYKETLIVIDNLVEKDYKKIPKEYIEFLKANCNNDYNFEYDKSKTFREQNILEETKYILFGIFENFWATEVQKSKIKSFKKNYYRKLENEKKKSYNPDYIFEARRTAKALNTDMPVKESSMVEYKEKNFIKKIFEKIKYKFKKIFFKT